MNILDQQIYDLRKRKEMLVALERLSINSDFKKVINEYYLEKHPLELVMYKGQLPLDPLINESINRQLDAVALFKTYLQNLTDELSSIDIRINEAIALRDEETRTH
jgi:hypothetical protein